MLEMGNEGDGDLRHDRSLVESKLINGACLTHPTFNDCRHTAFSSLNVKKYYILSQLLVKQSRYDYALVN